MCTAKMNASQRQEFCVRWNSHLGSIGAAFPQLLAGQRFVDVTLACEGQQVHCHRLVLAACSSYFESLLAENPCKHPVIILPSEIKLWEIQALVDFMYKGEVNVTQAGLPQLLRCAEQLRIRGLYGSDAALNLNQLKHLTSAGAGGSKAAQSQKQAKQQQLINDGPETDEATTSSSNTTPTAAANINLNLAQQQQQQQQQKHTEQLLGTKRSQIGKITIKKELQESTAQMMMNGPNAAYMPRLQQQQAQLQQQQQMQLLNSANNSNAATEDDDSADDSTTNNSNVAAAYSHPTGTSMIMSTAAAVAATGNPHVPMDSSINDDDHNYLGGGMPDHDDDDSYGNDTEHESSANSSAVLMQNSQDGSFKRIRRSEASLAQAAKCVSKGETFQNVSNMFNIPVSTIRFYMARKGILPKRKRGRGASSSSGHALASRIKQRSTSPSFDGLDPNAQFHPGMLSYKMNEQQSEADNMI